jgi:hypothetical protein
MEFHLFDIPLREAGNERGEPLLVLYLVSRGKKSKYIPITQYCSQVNEVLQQQGLGQVEVSPSDIIFALRSSNWRSLQRKRRPER